MQNHDSTACSSRRSWFFPGLLALIPVVVLICLLTGPAGIPDLATPTGQAILRLRLYRTLAGLIVGAGLAVSGTVLQALLRNPLAEPYLLGISGGGALGAAIAILFGLGAVSIFAVPLAAFAGAALTLTLVCGLASDRGFPSVYQLILSGVIVGAVASALLMFLISLASAQGIQNVMWWMLGSLTVGSQPLLAAAALLTALGISVTWALAPSFNAMTLGNDMAHHLGIRTGRVLLLGLAMASLMAAAAVSLAGIIGFVGLVVPHTLRRLIGPDHRRLIPAAALGGGLFLALCDTAARTVMAPRELPVGVLTALLGGPFFMVVLRRRRRGDLPA